MSLAPVSLTGRPGDRVAYLAWDVHATVPPTTTWRIDYPSRGGTAHVPVTGLISTTRAYTLTGLSNYAWYTVTLNGLLDSASLFSDTVMVMPTDIAVYLPLVQRGW
jgi:hypothetical protein